MKNKKVITFLSKNCEYCLKLENELKKEEIPYCVIDVCTEEGESIFENIVELTNSRMIPTIVVGPNLIVSQVSFNKIDEAVILIKKFLNQE